MFKQIKKISILLIKQALTEILKIDLILFQLNLIPLHTGQTRLSAIVKKSHPCLFATLTTKAIILIDSKTEKQLSAKHELNICTLMKLLQKF